MVEEWRAARAGVGRPGGVQAQLPVGSAADEVRVVVVLTVVLPSTLTADVVTTTLREREVPAARTGVRSAGLGSGDVGVGRVAPQPPCAPASTAAEPGHENSLPGRRRWQPPSRRRTISLGCWLYG